MKALADALADDAFSSEYITHLLRAPARPTYAIHTRFRSFFSAAREMGGNAPKGRLIPVFIGTDPFKPEASQYSPEPRYPCQSLHRGRDWH